MNTIDDYDISSLARIKSQLSHEQTDIEEEQALRDLYAYMDNISKTQYYIDVFENNTIKVILKNSDYINRLFLMFLKSLPQKTYKFEMIFIVFCDYNELPYNMVYQKLHTKIQKILDFCLMRIIGKKKFSKNYKKYIIGDTNIEVHTLMDAVNRIKK